jgi:PilZ domain
VACVRTKMEQKFPAVVTNCHFIGGRMEHRWGLRRDIDQAVHVWTAGGLASSASMLNISISGAFLSCPLPVQPLSRVKLQIKGFKGPGKVKLTAEAQVVRVERDGLAIEWCDFAPPAARALIRNARAEVLDRLTDERSVGLSRQA